MSFVGRAASGDFGPTSFAVDKALRANAYAICSAIASAASAAAARRYSGTSRRSDPARFGLAREFSPGEKPDGWHRGRSLVVSSDDLAHGSGREDFASILRGARLPHGPPRAVLPKPAPVVAEGRTGKSPSR